MAGDPISNEPLSKADAIGFSVLRLVGANPNLTQRELARRLDLSLGRVNYCIAALVEKGLIKVENFRASESKWRYAYVLTPQGIAQRAALAGRFLARKMHEYDALSAEIDALKAELQGSGKHSSSADN